MDASSGAVRLFFCGVDFLAHVIGSDRRISVDFAFTGSGHAAQNRRNDRILVGQHCQRRIGEQRIARTDSVHEPIDEAIDDEEAIMRLVLDAAAGQHAAIAQLENEKFAVRLVVERRGEGTNSRILVRQARSAPRVRWA